MKSSKFRQQAITQHCNNRGFVLATIIIFLMFMLFMVLGAARLGIVSQNYSGSSSDLALAQTYAHQAIFDNVNGAVVTISNFDSNAAWGVGAACGTNNQRWEDMPQANRLTCRNSYFTANCTNALAPTIYQRGLCNSAATNGGALPVFRVVDLGTKSTPCPGYSVGINGVNGNLPMIDVSDNSVNPSSGVYSFNYAGLAPGACHVPRYMIEMLSTNYELGRNAGNASYVRSARLYRVTARGYGRNGNTLATEVAYFYATCRGVNNCSVSLLSDQVVH